ncbi:hypothetical protein, conserved in T. vivax [Trypanosoma vivax Y486]|uniref:Uncharacterized protein n=1 Tax=Trypanosoma vivax (strain Y486) TaxID=1055687 RepID=F9WRL3_TRYVY|nr:hypothetical protein, conserved in T. vivax [Trypanosoma vivax Y486]|eukprot:CCD20197.1 hypothetical protein, conserved in T. vivax [Trypanosoma vivax Y486]
MRTAAMIARTNITYKKILNSSTEHIDTVNLTEWKDKALQVLNKTYNGIKLNTKKYHWSLTNGSEKIGDVQKAAVKAVARLEVAVKNFELYRVAVSDAVKKVNSASSMVEEANKSVLASVNGKIFCKVVGRFSNSNERLRAAGKKLTDRTQSAASVVTISKRVQAEVTIADELIKEVGVWLRGNNLALVHKLSGTHNVAKASNAMSTSVRAASKAVSIVNEIEQKMKTEHELIKFVETQLANMSAVAGTSIGDVEFDVCNSRVSEILKKESSEVIRSIARFNTTLLTRLNASLHKIDGKADAIGHKLLDVSKQVQEAKSSAQNVSLLAKRATENVREAIIEVLSGGAAELCAVLSRLRALHDEAGAFSVHAAHAQANISEWLVRVDASAKESDDFADLTGSVESAFAAAGKRLEVLKRVLHRTDEQRAKVVGELAASVAVKESDKHGPQINKTLHDVFANITSRVSANFSKDACNASLMTQSLKLLSNMTDHTVMNSLQVVTQLNKLTESMKERVLKADNLMRMATDSSAQADAARERSGKPQCPALYRQLLNMLGLHW